MKTFAPYYNKYNNFSGKSDFLPLAAVAAGVSSGGSILSSIGSIFSGRSQEKVNNQTALANQYAAEGFTPAYQANLKAFFDGMFIVKPTYYWYISRYQKLKESGTAAEFEKYESDLQAFCKTLAPLTPEMTGLSFKFPPKMTASASSSTSSTNLASNSTSGSGSLSSSLSATNLTSESESGSIKETLSKNKNTILIVVVVFLVLTIGYLMVKAVRK